MGVCLKSLSLAHTEQMLLGHHLLLATSSTDSDAGPNGINWNSQYKKDTKAHCCNLSVRMCSLLAE